MKIVLATIPDGPLSGTIEKPQYLWMPHMLLKLHHYQLLLICCFLLRKPSLLFDLVFRSLTLFDLDFALYILITLKK